MPFEMFLLRKWTAKSPFFSQKSYQIGSYRTYTGPRLPILFPMWPASQKELPTPELGCAFLQLRLNLRIAMISNEIMHR